MSDDLNDVGTLPPKSAPGKLYKPKVTSGGPLLAGAVVRSKPDLAIPKPEVLSDEKWFPVRMLRNYRPVGDYEIGVETEGEEPEFVAPPEPDEDADNFNPGLELQVKIGMLVHLRLSEARAVTAAGIAERADAMN